MIICTHILYYLISSMYTTIYMHTESMLLFWPRYSVHGAEEERATCASRSTKVTNLSWSQFISACDQLGVS